MEKKRWKRVGCKGEYVVILYHLYSPKVPKSNSSSSCNPYRTNPSCMPAASIETIVLTALTSNAESYYTNHLCPCSTIELHHCQPAKQYPMTSSSLTTYAYSDLCRNHPLLMPSNVSSHFASFARISTKSECHPKERPYFGSGTIGRHRNSPAHDCRFVHAIYFGTTILGLCCPATETDRIATV